MCRQLYITKKKGPCEWEVDLIQWSTDGTEKSEGNEGWFVLQEAKTLKQARCIPDDCEQEELREHVELANQQILQGVIQLPVTYISQVSEPFGTLLIINWQLDDQKVRDQLKNS